MAAPSDFWERPEVVAKFAERAPDERLCELVRRYEDPTRVRVLDAGCAAGRNTVFLARRGFDVHAVDASEAMVTETRDRLADVVGAAEARNRVRVGRMDDLGRFPDGSFALVVSLGLLHNARSWEEWRTAVAETARVLADGGLLLVSQFGPGTDLWEEGPEARSVSGARHLWENVVEDRRTILLDPGELDAGMAEAGLKPETPATAVDREGERGRRKTVKGLYRKAAGT